MRAFASSAHCLPHDRCVPYYIYDVFNQLHELVLRASLNFAVFSMEDLQKKVNATYIYYNATLAEFPHLPNATQKAELTQMFHWIKQGSSLRPYQVEMWCKPGENTTFMEKFGKNISDWATDHINQNGKEGWGIFIGFAVLALVGLLAVFACMKYRESQQITLSGNGSGLLGNPRPNHDNTGEGATLVIRTEGSINGERGFYQGSDSFGL